jgi:hypothetical protein
MLTIRSVTLQLPHDLVLERPLLDEIKDFFQEAETQYKNNNFKIRTKRICLDSLSLVNGQFDQHKIIGIVKKMNSYCQATGVRWFNVPFNLATVNNCDLAKIREISFRILREFPNTFINFIVADKGIINFKAISEASKFIMDVSKLDNSGFNNFRVGVSASPVANTPFFPLAYSGSNFGFSIALEIPQEINSIVKENISFEKIRNDIFEKLGPQLNLIEEIAKKIENKSNISYQGMDTSIAPYPEKGGSVAEIIQNLGIETYGANGTLFATSFLTDILKSLSQKYDLKTTGFCGVMYSMMEDEFLAEANNKKIISIDSIISYAAVCGCGVDMIPLPGDIFQEEISSIILDICAQSIKLKKPLGVRVLPIPYRRANEFTNFNMDFLYNTRIMNIKNIGFRNNAENESFSYIK